MTTIFVFFALIIAGLLTEVYIVIRIYHSDFWNALIDIIGLLGLIAIQSFLFVTILSILFPQLK